METYVFEATQGLNNGFNWGKFLVGRFSHEWEIPSGVDPDHRPLLSQIGIGYRHLLVMDLQTCEAAIFSPGGYAKADLDKHRIWVCPMFQPFLEWLYQQDTENLSSLPNVVELPDAEPALSGYRRPGPTPELPEWMNQLPVYRDTVAEFLTGKTAHIGDPNYVPPWNRDRYEPLYRPAVSTAVANGAKVSDHRV